MKNVNDVIPSLLKVSELKGPTKLSSIVSQLIIVAVVIVVIFVVVVVDVIVVVVTASVDIVVFDVVIIIVVCQRWLEWLKVSEDSGG